MAAQHLWSNLSKCPPLSNLPHFTGCGNYYICVKIILNSCRVLTTFAAKVVGGCFTVSDFVCLFPYLIMVENFRTNWFRLSPYKVEVTLTLV